MTDNGTVNAVLGVIGLALLLKGSGWMIDGAAAAAMRMRINETIVGLTLVSVGTSLPELATNVYAAIGGNTGVAVGNVGGSNITNVLLVLGVAAVMAKRIETDRDLYRRDSMVMLLAYIALCLVCYAGLGGRTVMRAEGALLLVIGFVYVAMLIRSGRADEADDDVEKMAAAKAVLLIVAWLIVWCGLPLASLCRIRLCRRWLLHWAHRSLSWLSRALL
jgi:cation:H+ antiporter